MAERLCKMFVTFVNFIVKRRDLMELQLDVTVSGIWRRSVGVEFLTEHYWLKMY